MVKEFSGKMFFICSGTDRQCTEKAGSERSADDSERSLDVKRKECVRRRF